MKITLTGSKQNLKNFIAIYMQAYSDVTNIALPDFVYLLYTTHTLHMAAEEHDLEVQIDDTITNRKHIKTWKSAEIETDDSRITINYK